MSFVRYLRSDKGADEETLRRFIALLLTAIENHTVEGDEADYQQFRAAIRELSLQFSPETSGEALLVMAGRLNATCKEYADRTRRFIRAHSVELQQIVSMLTAALTNSIEASEVSTARLVTIEKQIESAAVIEDVRMLRLKLAQCLESIQEEVVHRQRQAAVARAELERSGQAKESESPGAPVDPVTGIGGRPQAEQAIREALRSGRQHYLVVAVANRVNAINSRLGYAAGDRVLRSVYKQLQTFVSGSDRVFRWTGPAYVAVLKREATLEEVRKEVQRGTDSKAQELFEVESRSVLLPVSANWAVLPIRPPQQSLQAAVDQLVATG